MSRGQRAVLTSRDPELHPCDWLLDQNAYNPSTADSGRVQLPDTSTIYIQKKVRSLRSRMNFQDVTQLWST